MGGLLRLLSGRGRLKSNERNYFQPKLDVVDNLLCPVFGQINQGTANRTSLVTSF